MRLGARRLHAAAAEQPVGGRVGDGEGRAAAGDPGRRAVGDPPAARRRAVYGLGRCGRNRWVSGSAQPRATVVGVLEPERAQGHAVAVDRPAGASGQCPSPGRRPGSRRSRRPGTRRRCTHAVPLHALDREAGLLGDPPGGVVADVRAPLDPVQAQLGRSPRRPAARSAAGAYPRPRAHGAIRYPTSPTSGRRAQPQRHRADERVVGVGDGEDRPVPDAHRSGAASPDEVLGVARARTGAARSSTAGDSRVLAGGHDRGQVARLRRRAARTGPAPVARWPDSRGWAPAEGDRPPPRRPGRPASPASRSSPGSSAPAQQSARCPSGRRIACRSTPSTRNPTAPRPAGRRGCRPRPARSAGAGPRRGQRPAATARVAAVATPRPRAHGRDPVADLGLPVARPELIRPHAPSSSPVPRVERAHRGAGARPPRLAAVKSVT